MVNYIYSLCFILLTVLVFTPCQAAPEHSKRTSDHTRNNTSQQNQDHLWKEVNKIYKSILALKNKLVEILSGLIVTDSTNTDTVAPRSGLSAYTDTSIQQQEVVLHSQLTYEQILALLGEYMKV